MSLFLPLSLQQQLLECDKCHNSYHPECLGPNYPTRPTKKKRIWVCTHSPPPPPPPLLNTLTIFSPLCNTVARLRDQTIALCSHISLPSSHVSFFSRLCYLHGCDLAQPASRKTFCSCYSVTFTHFPLLKRMLTSFYRVVTMLFMCLLFSGLRQVCAL